MLEGYKAVYDATVIGKLKGAGAIFLGRTNMDEFAMGSSTENSAFGVTKNPCDTTRVAGGSSGGSAAAVAMGGALLALGSDTGGSVRQPASLCGVVGLKPTYGAVSRFGLIALGSSLDQIGPIGRTVEDVAILFEVIAGHDSADSTSARRETYQPRRQTGDRPLTIGIPRHLIGAGIDEDVRQNFEESARRFRALGYTIKEIALPNSAYSLAVYYIIMPAEASANLARFDGVKYGLRKDGNSLLEDYMKTRGAGFGREPRRRIILGTYVLSAGYYDAYYNKANAVRGLIASDFERAFSSSGGGVDVILTPTTPTPAFGIGEKTTDPLQMYLADIFTVTANIVGIPALSVPSGAVERGGRRLPVGIQLMAPHMQEKLLFRVGKEFLGENK
jgi:aspartyl-tRNA(Asn)/glutamyl-tRNA(Gln) amidotransferase subunit A